MRSLMKTNEILQELLTEMKIKNHIEHKDMMVTMKYSNLIELCIRLLKLEKENE